MGPNKYQLILIGIIAVLWLGVGNLIIYDAIRKKRLFFGHMLNPLIIFKFDKRDWAKFLLLIVSIIGLSWLTISLENKTEPDQYQLILIALIVISISSVAVLSIGAAVVKVYNAIRNKKISEIFDPRVVFGDKRDWIQTLLLIVLVVGLLSLIKLLYLK